MLRSLSKFQNSFSLHFALLFAAVLAFAGTKPPFANEWVYLLRLVRTYSSDFLLNDLSFSQPPTEHWLFNHIFGLLTYALSIEFIAWSGRILCWTVLLFAIIRLARHWEIPLWMITASVLLWLCRGQAVVGGEWIIGTFEAKNLAYICLLFALDGFAREKTVYPAGLLGLTFSFHPAVGLWGIIAAGLALLYCRVEPAKYLKIVGVTALFALPGFLPLIGEVAQPASVEDWKFVELVRYPQLFDSFTWSKTALCLVYLQLVFCILVFLAGPRSPGRKFLTAFAVALGLIFTAGLFLRGFEQYELLRFMPMRLFPVFIPLFFFFSLGEAFQQKLFAPPLKAAAVVGFVCLLFWQSPLSTATDQLLDNYRSWTTEMDDTAKCYVWLGENIPNGAIVIAPPWRQDLWYLSHRAQVVSSGFPTYLNLGEWRQRVSSLTGESAENRNKSITDERPAFYRSLTPEQITAIARRSNAEYLVSDGEYSFPMVFVSGKTKVYHLVPAGVSLPR